MSAPALKREDCWEALHDSLPDLIGVPILQFKGSYFEQSAPSITYVNSLLHWLLRVLLEMVVIDNLALSNRHLDPLAPAVLFIQ